MQTKTYSLEEALQFGKYKGKTVMDVARMDSGYISWALDNADCFDLDDEALSWFDALVTNLNKSQRY